MLNKPIVLTEVYTVNSGFGKCLELPDFVTNHNRHKIKLSSVRRVFILGSQNRILA